MRTLSAELLAAQKTRRHLPYIEYVRATTRRWGVQPLAPVRVYTESPAGHRFAACLAPDGSVCRVRVAPNGDVYTQRVADPANAGSSAWAGWTLLATGAASSVISPAIGTTAAFVHMAYVKPDGYTVVRRTSTTNGATWLGEGTVVSEAANPVRAVAVAARTGTDDRFFIWASGPNILGGDSVSIKYRTLYGASLGAVTVAPFPGFGQVEGLAAEYGGDYHFVATGQANGGAYWGAFTFSLGDGYALPAGTWTGLGTLVRAETDGYTPKQPSLASIAGNYRVAFWSQRGAGGSGKTECMYRVSPEYGTSGYSAPAPLGESSGPAVLVGNGGRPWLLCERSANTLSATGITDELGGRLLAYTCRTPGGMEAVFSNQDGPSAGAHWSETAGADRLAPGNTLQISRGLRTRQGPRPVPLHEHLITEVIADRDTGLLTVRAIDALGALAGWRSARLYKFASAQVATQMKAVAALAGVELGASGGLSAGAQRVVELTLLNDETALSAMRGLTALCPERLLPQGSRLMTVNLSSGSSVYTYGCAEHGNIAGGHTIEHWRLEEGQVTPNHVRVYGESSAGSPIYAEALDQGSINASGHRPAQVTDPTLTSQADADARATAELLAAGRLAHVARFESLPNLGLELWDLVTLQPTPGHAARTYRVTRIEERYNPARGEWRQRVELGGPDR